MFDDTLMHILQPYEIASVRLGSAFDGGYVIPEIALREPRTLISYGYGHNADFEIEFVKIHRRNQVKLYDNSINFQKIITAILRSFLHKLYLKRSFPLYEINNLMKYIQLRMNRKIQYFNQEVVSTISQSNQIPIENTLGTTLNRHYILKMDIEGAEYDCLEAAFDYITNASCLIIEFHALFSNKKAFLKIIKHLSSNFIITHVNINNFELSPEFMPQVLEITLLNKKLIELKSLLKVEKIPTKLDSPNNPKKPQVIYKF